MPQVPVPHVTVQRRHDNLVDVHCAHCGARATHHPPHALAFVQTHAHCRARVGLGDVIAAATKAVGIKPCTPCQQRQEALNRIVPLWRRR